MEPFLCITVLRFMQAEIRNISGDAAKRFCISVGPYLYDVIHEADDIGFCVSYLGPEGS